MIYIASDHRGYEVKEKIKEYLREKGLDVKDIGPYDYNKEDDYPDFAFMLGEAVVKGKGRGIIICGTGIGMSIAANKVKGIRAAKVDNIEEAKLSREHNDANVLVLGYTTYQTHKDLIELIEACAAKTDFPELQAQW